MMPNLLDRNEIKKYLSSEERMIPLEILPVIDSTNNYLKQIAFDLTRPISLCLAEEQTAGRGRFGKTWVSPFGVNLYLSCGWFLAKSINELAGLSLIAGLAVGKALQECGVKEGIKIKWPNDIFWQKQKIAGVLAEVSNEVIGYSHAVVGIGLNINHFSEPGDQINQPWTTLESILGYYQDRNKIAGVVIQHLLETMNCFWRTGLTPFLDEWQQYDIFLHKKVTLLHGYEEISGVGAGVNEQGHLLLKHEDGSIKAYLSGDITIKKELPL